MNAQKMREPLTEEERAKFERYAGEIFSRKGLDLNSAGGATRHDDGWVRCGT